MKRYLGALPGLLLALACLRSGGPAWAQIPLEPVKHVYPDSTLEEVQQALDNGGTVYFERLTRAGQYREYNQVARNAPDFPPTSADPSKGFNVGAYGRDVNIIGVLGPNGERPKINGGTVVFRVGAFPVLGFTGAPVNFRIENLEMFNPDLGPPMLIYSRIGILVNLLGPRSTINNCKITVTGNETDPGHAVNHSVAIWFYLPAQPPAPPSGAVIDITNNTVAVSKAHEGIHADSFWPVVPGFTPPRVFILNNSVAASNLGGFPNGGGTNGATLATAIILQGNVPNSIIANNMVRGDGRSPNLTPKVEAVGVTLWSASPDDVVTHVTVAGNDLAAFSGDFQMRLHKVVSAGTIARNSFGPAGIAGVWCSGHENTFVNNEFHGLYPGWTPLGGGPGLVWFDATSRGNRVEGTKLNAAPHGSDICGQVLDDTGGANEVRGYEKCR